MRWASWRGRWGGHSGAGRRPQRADQISHAGGANLGQRFRQRLKQAHRGDRLRKIGCADLHSRGAGDEEFHAVIDRHDAPHADDREVDSLAHLIHAAQRNRLDGRSAQASDAIAEHWPPPPPVDRHALAGVDEREGIGATVACPSGDAGDVGDIRRELGDHGQPRHPAHARHDAAAELRIGPQIDTMAHVGAGDVQLQASDAGHPLQAIGQLHKLPLIGASDAHDHRRPTPEQKGELGLQEGVDAVVVEPDRIEQAGGGFHGAPRHVSLARQRRDRLGHDAAEPGKIDVASHLPRVAKRARRHQNRVGQPQAADHHRQIDLRWLDGGAFGGWASCGKPVGWGHDESWLTSSGTGRKETKSLATRA